MISYPRLNALAAERVMGFDPEFTKSNMFAHYHNYSGDMSVAMELLLHASKDSVIIVQRDDEGWCAFLNGFMGQYADSPALAITVAALRAVGVSESEIQEAMR